MASFVNAQTGLNLNDKKKKHQGLTVLEYILCITNHAHTYFLHLLAPF